MVDLKFSVVMAAYRGDLPKQLYAAGESIFNQTRVPDELVIVFDGPVDFSHEQAVEGISKLGAVRVLRLDRSIGPGGARHRGIVTTAYDVVAIMDADDVCLATRFEKQIKIIEAEEADVVGGWIREFD